MPDELPLARRDLIAARLAEGQSVASVQLAAEFGNPLPNTAGLHL